MKKLGREREVHSCQRIVKNVACTALRGEREPCTYSMCVCRERAREGVFIITVFRLVWDFL